LRKAAAGGNGKVDTASVNAELTISIKLDLAANGIFAKFPLTFFRKRHRAASSGAMDAWRTGNAVVAEIADIAVVRRASLEDAPGERVQTAQALSHGAGFSPLSEIPAEEWRRLAERAIEPNGYYLPAWELAVNASARGRTGVSALSAWSEPLPGQDRSARLIGLLPVVSLWRACRIPLPALVAASPYGTLCTPLIDRTCASEAIRRVMAQARAAGAHALVLCDASLNGAAMRAFTEILRQDGTRPLILQSHCRAFLDARHDADECLRDVLGGKKLKELRRQRNRLAEHGAVRFEVARSPEAVAAAIETFLELEASGWKGKRGTALGQDEGDAAFIRRASKGLAETGQCEIVTLHAGETPVASAIVLWHLDRAFYFKLGIDEQFAKFSPGVQLTLDLTRQLCADPSLATADSTASADHPMINPIWRGRLKIGDVVIPLRRNDPVVSLIHAAMATRLKARELIRRAFHLVR
jgi:Acetyltransferase (GNAT) domain